MARWHSASAAASAASAGCGGRARRRRACTIFWTCSLGAAPQPATASLHLVRRVLGDLAAGAGGLGQGQPARLPDAHRRAHVDLEEHVLDGDDVGSNSAISAASSVPQGGEALGQRLVGGVRITPSATAARRGRPPSTTAYPQRVSPGSMPSTRVTSGTNTSSNGSQSPTPPADARFPQANRADTHDSATGISDGAISILGRAFVQICTKMLVEISGRRGGSGGRRPVRRRAERQAGDGAVGVAHDAAGRRR